MKFGEFMVKLQQQQDCHLFLLAGEEHYYIDKALKRIMAGLFSHPQDAAESVQKITADIDTDDLIGMIETAPFFADKNVLLLRNTALFKD
ncbi:MAG: DNA polymerase III subunit delta, partial [Selenomonas sp.]|nr:DNA polymerase III subunit delta [Selenomonas sp.]